jgi:general stress protein 26
MIKDIKFAMFTTRHRNGHLHARPMTTQNTALDADDSLWFFMSKKSGPVDDILANPVVGLVVRGPVVGHLRVGVGHGGDARGRRQEAAALNKAAEAWFPGGPTDPDLALVQVEIIHANYWDVEESKPVQLFAMAKSLFTGKPPQLGEHAEVRMR